MLAYRVARLKNATVSKIADFSRERNLGCRARDRRGPRLRIFEFFQHRFLCHIVLERFLADMLSVVFGICRDDFHTGRLQRASSAMIVFANVLPFQNSKSACSSSGSPKRLHRMMRNADDAHPQARDT